MVIDFVFISLGINGQLPQGLKRFTLRDISTSVQITLFYMQPCCLITQAYTPHPTKKHHGTTDTAGEA